MTKLLLILPSFAGGGAERVMVHLANSFIAKGINLVLIVQQKAGPLLQLLDPRVPVETLFKHRPKAGVLSRVLEVLRIANLLGLPKYRGRTTLVTLRKMNLLVSLAHWISGSSGKLVLREADTLDSLIRNPGIRSKVTLWSMRLMYSRASGVVANSMSTRNDLLKYLKLRPQSIRVIYNPIPVEQFVGNRGVSKALTQTGKPMILAIGRLAKKKNFDDLISAFKNVAAVFPESELFILGDGPERDHLSSLVRDLGLEHQVFLPGFVNDVEDFLLAGAVFVQTSLWEGFGYVLAEAMLADLPVVAYDSKGAIREIVGNSPFVNLVPPGDKEGLSQAIIDALRAEESVSHSALVRDRFDSEKISAQYLAYLQLEAANIEPLP